MALYEGSGMLFVHCNVKLVLQFRIDPYQISAFYADAFLLTITSGCTLAVTVVLLAKAICKIDLAADKSSDDFPA